MVWDAHEADDLKVIDLGAGHSSSGGTLCGRVIGALKSEALLNESVGAGYIERNWPPAFRESGAWPLASLRQSFLDGSLTRLIDPDMILRGKIADFVGNGDFGLASGRRADGSYERWWFTDVVGTDEVVFEPDVFLRRQRGRAPGDPRPGRGQLRGRGKVAGVPARPGRPRPVRRAARHQRLPSRAAGRDRRGAARRVLAALPGALRTQPRHQGGQVSPALGLDPGPHHLRAARRRVGPRPAPPGRDRAGGQVPGRCRPSR